MVPEDEGVGMRCIHCRNVFQEIGDAYNSPVDAVGVLERAASVLVKQFQLKGCHFRLLSRDQRILEDVASVGLSEKYLGKGPVDAEKSVAEALEGRVVAVLDCATDPRIQYPKEHVAEGIVSQLTVPLSTRGQVIGVMRLSTAERREFSDEEIDFFKVCALFCASAVTHTMFHRILEDVTESIRSSLDLDEVLKNITRVVAEDLRTKGCTIQLFDERGELLQLRASFGMSARFNDAVGPVSSPAAQEALSGGRCVAVLDGRTDPRIPYPDEAAREKFASMLFVPLMCRDRAIGLMVLFTHHPYSFSDEEIHMMTAIGEQAALAIRNAQMYAAIKTRYNNVVDDFHQWFEHYCVYPTSQRH